MKKHVKIILSVLAGILVLVVILISLNNFAENKIKKALEDALTQSNLKYAEVDVNLLSRKAGISEPTFDLKGKKLSAEQLTLNNIGIFKFLKDNDEIVIGDLLLKNPKFQLIKDEQKGKDENEDKRSKEFSKSILVKDFRVEEGTFSIKKNESAKNTLYSKLNELQFKNIKLDSASIEKAIPFTYDSYSYKSDSLFYKMDSRHNLVVGEIEINNGETVLRNTKLIPLYGKQEFQQHIPHELDRFEFTVEEVRFSDLQWEIKNDSLNFTNPLLTINNPSLEVYRDKLQPEDTRQKKMYSHMIRDLPVKIKLDTIKLRNAYIKYEEKVAEDRSPGEVDFKNLHASIYNISNINMQSDNFKTTDIDVEALFMQEANLTVNWNFNISNRNDVYNISGDMDRLSQEAMNRFLTPALNVEAEGGIEDMRFNFRGNNTQARGEMKFVYEDFKVEVLRRDGKRKNKILSAIANLFIKNDAQQGEQQQEGLEIKRDKTKSFWNYLWLSIREGALKAFL